MRARIKRIQLKSVEATNKYISAENRIYGIDNLILVYNSRFIVDRIADRKLAFR